MNIAWYVGRRILLLVPILLGVTFITFALTRILPGNPVDVLVGRYVSPHQRELIAHQLGLDRPFYVQYVIYVGNLLHGNLGRSFTTGRPVVSDLDTRLPATLELTFYGMLIAVVLAVPLGVIAALRRNTWIDGVARVLGLTGLSLPVFWVGIMLSALLAYRLGIAPPPVGRLPIGVQPPAHITGVYTIDSILTRNWSTLGATLDQIWLPAFVMGIAVMAPIMRQVRQGMIEALDAPPTLALRALGLRPSSIVLRHGLKNAMLPVLTVIAVVFGFLLGGSVLIENIFSWPGIGLYVYNAISTSDFPAVQGFILYATTMYIVVFLVVDILYLVLDPRVRY